MSVLNKILELLRPSALNGETSLTRKCMPRRTGEDNSITDIPMSCSRRRGQWSEDKMVQFLKKDLGDTPRLTYLNSDLDHHLLSDGDNMIVLNQDKLLFNKDLPLCYIRINNADRSYPPFDSPSADVLYHFSFRLIRVHEQTMLNLRKDNFTDGVSFITCD